MPAKVYPATVTEDGDAYALARLTKKDSSHNMVIATSSDISTIVRTVTIEGTTVIGPTSLTPSSSNVLASYSTGDIWDVDTTGFNFIDLLPSTAFPNGGVTYRLEYKFTTTGGNVYFLLFDATTLNVAGS